MNDSSGSNGDLLVGTLVGGRYRIEEELGRGGMGVVYLALHVELEQRVALKVLTSEVLATVTAVDRFLREARTTASLGHPNIVRVTDLGKLDDGRPFLVMERLEGAGLDALLEAEGRFTAERAAPFITEAAAALDAIHARGLVHRDVKPENLFVAKNHDGTETTKLVDFGLVGMSRPDLDDRRLTQTGLIYGTPDYMAPETMADRTPSPSWDVYSLAVVAFELLTGTVPFAGSNPLQTLTRRTLEDPPRLADAIDASFPESIEQVVAKGLSRFAETRYASAGELARALELAVRGQQATASLSVPSAASAATSLGDGGDDAPRRPSVGTPIRPLSQSEPDEEVSLPTTRLRMPLIIAAGAGLAVTAALAFALAGEGDDEIIGVGHPHAAADAAPDETPGAIAGAADPPSVESDATTDQAPDAAPTPRTDVSEAAMRPVMRPAVEEVTEARPSAEALDAMEQEANRALSRGNVSSAYETFRTVTRAAPRRPSAWRGLGVASERLGRSTDAIRAYQRFLALAPGAPEASAVRQRLSRLSDGE